MSRADGKCVGWYGNPKNEKCSSQVCVHDNRLLAWMLCPERSVVLVGKVTITRKVCYRFPERSVGVFVGTAHQKIRSSRIRIAFLTVG